MTIEKQKMIMKHEMINQFIQFTRHIYITF